MRDARSDGKIVIAGPDSPNVAECPACGGEVHKRSRRRMDGGVTYYYRHRRGVGENCSKRYHLA